MAPSRRERELARRRYERQAARRAEQARKKRKRNIVAASIVVVVLVLGGAGTAIGFAVSGGKSTKSTLAAATPTPAVTGTPTASASASPAASTSASTSASPSPSVSASPVADTRPLACYLKKAETLAHPETFASEPPLTVSATKTYTMTIYTPCGVITAALDVKDAPHAVNSFNFLASKGFFDGSECHRVTTDPTFSVLQCGDPTATGTGGPGYKFIDENLANASYTRGTLAMANSGANTNGSQFFLVDKDSTALPKSYTVFGHITSGIGVLDRIVSAGVAGGGTDGKPAKRIFINSLDVKAS